MMYFDHKIKSHHHFLTYWPLLALVFSSILLSAAISLISYEVNDLKWLHYFIGVLLFQVALIKIFNPVAFADGFVIYDTIAKRTRIYAFIYPFIELTLGILYITLFHPLLYFFTAVFMIVGTIGVIDALRKKIRIYCPCFGAILKLPHLPVILGQDILIALLALYMLFA